MFLRETSTAARTPTRLHIIPRYVTEPRYPLVDYYYISLFTCLRAQPECNTTDARLRTDSVSHHRTDVSNCSALLSRDHTAALAHASSRMERRSFDELTRTVNHGYGGGGGEGLASSERRKRPSPRGPGRTCTNPHEQERLCPERSPNALPRCVAFVPPRGCRVTTRSRATRTVHRLARRLHSLSFCSRFRS